MADSPSAACGLADEGVEVLLAFGAFTGAKANRPETGAANSDIEVANTGSAEDMKGLDGFGRVVGLHKNPTHAKSGPVRLEETWLGCVIPSKTRGGGDGELQFVPEMKEWGVPEREEGVSGDARVLAS